MHDGKNTINKTLVLKRMESFIIYCDTHTHINLQGAVVVAVHKMGQGEEWMV